MGIISSKILQNKTSSVSAGDYIYTTSVDTLVLSIYGTSTSFTINFEGSLDGTNFFLLSGSKLADATVFSTTTSILNEAWEFDVSALSAFRANITAIGNGNVTVVANITV